MQNAEQKTQDLVVSHEQELPILPHPETSTSALVFEPESLDKMMRLAEVMATSKVTVPKHLSGSPADCLAVVMQAMQWGMNPFAVGQKTHLVNGTLGYEAQLVNAVIISRAPVRDRLHFEWFGDWTNVNGKTDKSHDRGVRVWATLKGEDEPREYIVTMAQVGVRNSPNWEHDPRLQIAYLGVKKWSRLYCPDVILGVYTPDEIETFDRARDITPPRRPAEIGEQARPQAQDTEGREGLIESLEHVAREHGENALADTWGRLTKKERKAVGPQELERLKNLAIDADLARAEGAADE